MEERDRKEGEQDIKIRRDTQVRGSLGVPPSGGGPSDAGEREERVPEFDRERSRGSLNDDDDRMSER